MSRRRTRPTTPAQRPGAAPPRATAPTPPAPRPARPPARAAHLPAPPPWHAHLLPIGTAVVLAAILYAPSVAGPFVYDDPNAISQSALVRSLWPITPFLTLSTRPLTDYSYAIDYAISGLETTSFHVTSIALHCANAALLYAIAWMTLGLPALAARYGAARREIAWAAAVLFAVHPLASETVAYISSRSEVLVAFWYLLAVAAYASAVSLRRGRTLATVIVPLASAAALGSKEIAVTLPLALVCYQWLLVGQGDWRRARPPWRLLGLSALPLAVGGTVLLVRAYLNPLALGQYGATAGLGFDRFSRWEYLGTQFGVLLHYLRLVALPIGQTFDYDWPLARTPFALGVLVPLVLLGALVTLAWRQRRTWPLFAFTVAWMLLILAPTSSVMPIADLAVERRMYLPLTMIALCAAAALHDLVGRLSAAQRAFAWAGLVVVATAALSVATWQRATLWGDAIALHEDGVAKAPTNPRTRLNLGVTYLNTGDPERAYTTLVEAKRLYDSGESIHAFPRIGAFIHYNLGAVLFARGQLDEAGPQLERSLELGGQYLALRPMAYMLLSRVAANNEEWLLAAERMTEALRYQENADWRVDLAQMYLKAGRPLVARGHLVAATNKHPNNARVRQALQEFDARAKARPKGKPRPRRPAAQPAPAPAD